MRIHVTLLLALWLIPTPGEISAEPTATRYRPVVGQSHPDFSLPSIDGSGAIRLSNFRGKKVLLIHFASW